MPTYTVGSGKTYATLALAVAAIPSNISGTGVHEIIIDAGTYGIASTSINKSGESASDYIYLHAAAGAEHHGSFSSGVIFASSTFGGGIYIMTDFTRVKDIISTQSQYGYGVGVVADDCILTNVLTRSSAFTDGGSGSPSSGINIVGARNTCICCVSIPASGSAGRVGFRVQTGANNVFYNCGSYGHSVMGFVLSGTTPTVRNCWAASSPLGYTTVAGTFSNNASTDSSAPGASSLTNKTLSEFSFVDVSGLNFHLSAGSVLRATGVDLSATFTMDVDGTTITAWPIGFDFTYGPGSVVIGTDNYSIRPWPSFSITPAIQWIQDSAGYWNGSDRGAAQDAYEATAVFHGREPVINTLEQTLDTYREAITLSSFAAPLFAPNVDHTGSISAVVLGYTRRQVQWGAPYATHQIYELEVRFRAIAPTLLATTPSWATLRVQDGFRAEHSHESPKAFTYAQAAVYGDHASDIGTFEGSFSQKTAEIQAILAYLLTTARASAVTFPAALVTVAYPWGRARGAATNCKVLSFECSRKNLNRWALSLKLVEAP